MKRNKKILGIMIALGVVILGLGGGCVTLFGMNMLSVKDTYTTVDPEQYGKWEGHIENEGLGRNCGLKIFPDSLENVQSQNYYYYYQNTNMSIDESLIYLEATYDDAQFQHEIERLGDIQCEYEMDGKEQPKQIVYDESLFSYPAYIATYCSDLSYEYALVNEKEKKIAYIYANLADFQDMIPKEYLPLEVEKKSGDMYAGNSMDNTNIYFIKESDNSWIHYE